VFKKAIFEGGSKRGL